jgi:hypothetical protein
MVPGEIAGAASQLFETISCRILDQAQAGDQPFQAVIARAVATANRPVLAYSCTESIFCVARYT